MKSFKCVAAQGEVTIRRLGDVPTAKGTPSGFSPLSLERGRFVIGHSETQHDHVLSSVDGASVSVMDRPPAGMRILHMILDHPMSLDHLRTHNTHESIALEPGEYEVRIAREFDHYAELARQSQD